MLATFRSHAKGWIAWVFVILVSVPFALWGIGQYRSLITTDYVAKVNGIKIMPQQLQQAYERAFQQRQTELKGQFNPNPKEQLQLKMDALRQLINSSLLQQQASNDRMLASNNDVQAQIEQIPQFQANGHFDYQQYKLVLANNNLSVDQFENQVRTQIMTQQLQEGIARSTIPTPREVSALVALQRQQRKVSWFVLPLKQFMPSNPPAAAAIQTYYQAHQAQYSTPETVTISYLQLDKQVLASRVKVTPEALQDYYRTHQSQYGIPPARKVAEILIKPATAGTAAVAAAKAKAEKLLAQIKATKDRQTTFAALARKDSDDPISRRNGGSIGYVARGQLPETLDNAVFGLSGTGAIAGPVHTSRGWVLLQLLDKRAGSVQPFAKVKARVTADYTADKAKDLYYKLDGDFANLTYEHAGSLDATAKALDLKILTVSGVTREKGTGIAQNKQVRKAAFSDSVLSQHQNSNPIKLGNENAVVLRVSNVTPSKVKPLSVVRQDIVAALSQQKARETAAQASAEALAKLRAGQSMVAVAKEQNAAMHGPQQIGNSDSKLPPNLVQAAFTLAPTAGSKARYATVTMPDGGQAVYALLGVKLGQADNLKPAEQTAYTTQLGDIYAEQSAQDYLSWLRSKADIKVVKSNIQ
ncbi:MAG: SurA N-terminal domain-containing protein [Gammaproteobacteria bacterium]